MGFIMQNKSKPIVKKSGYVYAVIFSNDLIKVGRSRLNPEGRISTHLSQARLRGENVRVSQEYISEKTFFSKEIEASLICHMAGQCEKLNREWFLANDGFKFSELVAFASGEIHRHSLIDCVEPTSDADADYLIDAIDAHFAKKEQDPHRSVDDEPNRPILDEMKRAWASLGVSIARGDRVDIPINQLKDLLDDAQFTGID